MHSLFSRKKNSPRCILLTGVTGYVGKALLFELMSTVLESADADHDKVIVAIRKSHNKSAKERFECQVKADEIFRDFSDSLWDKHIAMVETTGLNGPNCGFSTEALATLQEANVTHVLHCAADVKFDRELSQAAASNITAALEMQKLVASWKFCRSMAFVSTAFVNPRQSSKERPFEEAIVDLPGCDAKEVYESMLGDQDLAMKVKQEFGFINNYVFTKCIAEKMLVQNATQDCKLLIVRPGIVGPAYQDPYAGWNGHRPSTITAFWLLFYMLPLVIGPLSKPPVAMIPVDTVARETVTNSLNMEEEVKVMHLVVDHSTADSLMPSSQRMGVTYMTYAIYDERITVMFRALVAFCLSHLACASETIRPVVFPVFVEIFNKLWLRILLVIQSALSFFGLPSGKKSFPAHTLLHYLDILDGYWPFVLRGFYFVGLPSPGKSYDKEVYINDIWKAVKAFSASIKEKYA